MKKFMNQPATVVDDYLRGLAGAHRSIVEWDSENRVLQRRDGPSKAKVGLVGGGGSGCEPTHTGFVGYGMLDAAAPGQIFTSPGPNQIVAATRRANQGKGVLHVIKNFTGEVMNFGMAEEILYFEDIDVAQVIVNDDVSIPDDGETAGRRGLGATVFVEKIAGAAAEQGYDLASVKALAERVIARSGTFSVGLSSCTSPARGKPVYELGDAEMDLGIGISGEPGRERVPLGTAQETADIMANEVLSDLAPPQGAELLMLVNGMGGTPHQELYLLAGELAEAAISRGFSVERQLVGSFVTSLDQAGAAVTFLQLDDELKRLWDAPVETVALRWGR
ncbi:dihydroxyacetone kinase-like protein [Arthrobacter pigmenti]|uniref:Dihydroxyacetone kinase-like protein n=1 Tax=Arthrobacter pigmenti TaxID=271432 RepID=A0A846RMZ7_9MICC|nr:dihydroxyacetone kinase subunit DhaK [Arthrobacter pigmenti]NJC21507.1 dihydroxyacetone kinase-like protein [Arthrobacter pigmenti]